MKFFPLVAALFAVVPSLSDAYALLRLPTNMVFESFGKSQLKAQILQLGASLDRGQAYNPTSGEYYKDRMDLAVSKVKELITVSPPLPTSLDAMDGEWELVYSSVAHGIFRSSPFFLAIQEAYSADGPEGASKAQLFFKLHELQTCSWGVSKIGRVAQFFNSTAGTMSSEFDTSIFSLTVLPIIGWFKLLPTFGGCVVTVSKTRLNGERIEFEVDYTTSKPVPGLSGAGDFIFGKRVPVNAIWKLLPWNKGSAPTCFVTLRYLDEDFRVVEDRDGDYFVYSRPVAERP